MAARWHGCVTALCQEIMLLRVFGSDNNGTLTVVESHDAPGGGPPPHIHHREDETFQVLEGECVPSMTGKLSVVLTPPGFENFFAEIGAVIPEEQQNIPRVLEIAKEYGWSFWWRVSEINNFRDIAN